MKRDIELIRDLLLCIEESEIFNGTRLIKPEIGMIGITTWNVNEALYNITQLVEAGFIAGNVSEDQMPFISKLTWTGHDLLDDIRDPDVWKKTKNRLKAVSGGSVDLLMALARAEARLRLGLLI
jgi:hypothetical protein